MKPKVSFIVSAMVMVIAFTGLTSCLTEGGNTSSYDGIPSYVQPYGILENNVLVGATRVYAPWLETQTGILSGDYVVASFTIDFDNQPAGADYYTAELYQIWESPVSYLFSTSGQLYQLSTNSTVNVEPYSLLLLNRKMFVTIEEYAPEDREFDYRIVCNTDSTKNGIPSVYIQSTVLTEGSGADITYQSFRTFDMSALISSEFAKQETIDQVSCTTVQFNLYYQTVNTNGEVVYKASARNPWTITHVNDSY
ncbi:MAG: hypothetical protein LBR67_07810 [Dysgonamonadaceae bacterium]|jgi:hypothetical protein|nr:hypothetical protein [Dysgonamonadaceae bacterium]